MTRSRPPLTVTPWCDQEEWEQVRELVLARDAAALQYFDVWRLRVARLPAGVETTASLLQSHVSKPHTCLSLATSINRFLNQVSHIGMNMFGLTRMHEAAEMLSVPEWIVELRHDTTHGHMPGLTMLRAGLEFSLSWLETHYWRNYQSLIIDDQETEESERKRLLECFMYLKLYKVWGTERMSELRSQCEVWSHLQDLWRSVKQSEAMRLEDISVSRAVGAVKTEICSLIDREGEDGIDNLVDTLVNDGLLVPDNDFLESLDGWSGGDEVEVPDQLVQIWSDFINITDRQEGVKLIVDKLIKRVKSECCELSAAWVVTLVQAMLGQVTTDSPLNITQTQVSVTCLETWLHHPNNLISQMCPLLCQLAGVTDRRVEALVKLFTGDKLSDAQTITTDSVYTDAHLSRDNDKDHEETKNTSPGWVLDTEHNWESIKYGAVLGSSDWSSLWVDAHWNNNDTEEEEDVVPTFEIEPMDWSIFNKKRQSKVTYDESPKKEQTTRAHFYTDTNYVDREFHRERKRMKKA